MAINVNDGSATKTCQAKEPNELSQIVRITQKYVPTYYC